MKHHPTGPPRHAVRNAIIVSLLVFVASCDGDDEGSGDTTAATASDSAAPETTDAATETSETETTTTETTETTTTESTDTSIPASEQLGPERTCVTVNGGVPSTQAEDSDIAFCLPPDDPPTEGRALCMYLPRELVITGELTPTEVSQFSDGSPPLNIETGGPKNAPGGVSLYHTKVGVDSLDAALALADAGRRAAPNYIVGSTQIYIHSPASDPVSLDGSNAVPPLIDAASGTGYGVGVMDTGLDSEGLISALDAQYGQPPDFAATIKPSTSQDADSGRTAGHGTFIASIIARVAPAAKVAVYQAPPILDVEFLDANNDPYKVTTTDEYRLAQEITAKFPGRQGDPDTNILNLSLGTYGCGMVGMPDFVRAPVATREALLLLDSTYASGSSAGLGIVAAAGNHHEVVPFYPAAFTADPCFSSAPKDASCTPSLDRQFLFAVGSTASPNLPAPFSNDGPWVSFYARGNDVAGWKPEWSPSGSAGSTQPAGWYSWSGTSFATPCAAAMAIAKSGAPSSPGDSSQPLTALRGFTTTEPPGPASPPGLSETEPQNAPRDFVTCD